MGLVVRAVGRGTGLLSQRVPGPVDVIGPLGTGFTLLRNARVLLAGGGVGNAPLYYLARELAAAGCEVTFLYGARSRNFGSIRSR